MQATTTNSDRSGATRHRIWTAGLALIVPLLILTGCGDANDSEGATAPLPKDEFLASADRICMRAGEKSHAMIDDLPPFEEITAPNVSRSVMLEVGRAAPRIAAVERGLARELRALDAPTDLTSRWDRALTALEQRAVAAADIGVAAEAGDRSAYLQAFQRFVRGGSVSSAALHGYGFEACAI